MSRLPCKNVNVTNSICANTGRYCIGCNNYEAMKPIIVDNPIIEKKVTLPELPNNSDYRNKKK
jgi:hypothetical protein